MRTIRGAALATLAATAAGLGCGSALATPSVSAGGPTELRIVYLADGARPERRIVRRLACDPPRGTLPRRFAACAALARTGGASLRPVPPDTACTELYGGPQVLVVVGRIAGRPVWVQLRRDDGCQIARWERNARRASVSWLSFGNPGRRCDARP